MPEETLRVEATVKETLPNAMFRVELDSGHSILAYVAGKMRFRFASRKRRILPGDRVTIEISTYDPTKGRIVWREK